jgi:hypothetical protein
VNHPLLPLFCSPCLVLNGSQLAKLKLMAHRGLFFVATVGIPLAKCNNGNNNKWL